ncbi:MAG: ArgE/DapE family deacylase [Anaerolineae bacterium]
MSDLMARVSDAVEQHRESMVSLLQSLVRQPSTLGNERPVQEVIHRKWQSLGLESTIWELDPDSLAAHPAYAPVEWGYAGRPNVTAVLRSPQGGGRSLVINGHVDVVSPEPLSLWTHDPWEGEILGGRMYGRGTADMKGGIAMAALALESLLANGVTLRGDLILETVIEEECSGNGTLACRLAGYQADGALICEPYALQANVATMGVMWFRVMVQGRSGHVRSAREAVNAIEKCFPLVEALRQLEERMNSEITHPLYRDLEHPINLNLGIMQGGDWPSTVPASCQFACRISYPPGVSPSEVRRRIEGCVAEAASRDPWLRQESPVLHYYGFRAHGSQVDVQSPLVQILKDCHRSVLGEELGFAVSTACDDTRYFNHDFGVPAVGYGPAGAGIHGADEYVELDSIATGAKVLARFIMEWCGVASSP